MIKMLDHEYIYVVYISGTLIEQSLDGFNVVVRKNYKLKESEWSKSWVDMPQDLYNNFKSWLFDWIFQQELKDKHPGMFKIK